MQCRLSRALTSQNGTINLIEAGSATCWRSTVQIKNFDVQQRKLNGEAERVESRMAHSQRHRIVRLDGVFINQTTQRARIRVGAFGRGRRCPELFAATITITIVITRGKILQSRNRCGGNGVLMTRIAARIVLQMVMGQRQYGADNDRNDRQETR